MAYISEPFHPGHRPGICRARFDHWFEYVTEANEEPYLAPLACTLGFRYDFSAELQTLRGPRDVARLVRDWGRFRASRLLRRRALVKDPIALLAAPWLASRFDMRVVVLIRHPAAFASSLKRLDWRFDFANLLDQDLLLADGAIAYVEEMERLVHGEPDIIDQAALLWKVLYEVVDRYREEHPDWIFLRHEDVSRSPLEQFRCLFGQLDVGWTDDVERYVQRTTRAENPAEAPEGQAHQLQRDSQANVTSWKGRLQPVEIERIRRGTEPVASRFYGEADW